MQHRRWSGLDGALLLDMDVEKGSRVMAWHGEGGCLGQSRGFAWAVVVVPHQRRG